MLSSKSYRKQYQLTLISALFLLIAATIYTSTAQAVPAFARQVGVECNTCHFQHYPKLNAFGRNFKASGFSMSGQELMEGDKFSLSPLLNASFFIKTRITDSSNDTNKAEYSFPDEAALLVGGRLAEGMGGIVEMADEILSYKISLTKQLESGMNVGTTIFTTDGLGAAYGFELMNTGAVRNHRPFERSSKASLGQNGTNLSGAATGIALHAQQSDWFAALTLYAPDDRITGASELDAGTSLSTYLRAAWMPGDIGVGFGKFSGETEATCADAGVGCTEGKLAKFVTEAWFIDAQYQGEVAGKALGAYFMYAKGDDGKVNADSLNMYNAGFADAPTGFGVDLEYSMMDDIHLLLAYGHHDNGDSTQSAASSIGLGAYWIIKQNVTLQPMFESFSGEQITAGHRVTLHFEAAF